jgi:acyl-CoA synthetase (AMP-forming)/AMP-acid ligase II
MPKGVQITHRSVLNFLTSMRQMPGFTLDDVLLAVTTCAFDISVLEIFLPLIAGGKVVVAPREACSDGVQLANLIVESGATVIQATPTTWHLLLEANWKGNPGKHYYRIWLGNSWARQEQFGTCTVPRNRRFGQPCIKLKRYFRQSPLGALLGTHKFTFWMPRYTRFRTTSSESYTSAETGSRGDITIGLN